MCPPPTSAAPPLLCTAPVLWRFVSLAGSANFPLVDLILHLRVSVLEGFVCKCVTDLIWFDLQQNRMLLNQNFNSNIGLLVHLREAICSKSWISFLWNQDRRYQLGRIATVLVFEQINLEVEKVQIGFTEFAKSL